MPKKTIGCLAGLLILAGAYYVSGGGIFYYSDPIRARVIDEHTGRPVEGAVVIAIWYLQHWHSSSQWHAAEAVSDRDGYFVIAAMPRRFRPWFGELQWRDPWLYFYKPGYEVAERNNKDAYIHPIKRSGQRLKTTTTSDGRIISEVATYSGASKRFSYWNGKTIPLVPHQDNSQGEGASLDRMMRLATVEELNPARFPMLWRSLVAGYDRVPASARPNGLGNVRDQMNSRINWP